jgi:hypothetical protein
VPVKSYYDEPVAMNASPRKLESAVVWKEAAFMSQGY